MVASSYNAALAANKLRQRAQPRATDRPNGDDGDG